MVGEHLPVIFPPCFNIDDQDLLEPKSILSQCIPFEKSCNLTAGPIGPQLLKIHPVIRFDEDILPESVFS